MPIFDTILASFLGQKVAVFEYRFLQFLQFRVGHPSKNGIWESVPTFMILFKKCSKSSSRLHARPKIAFLDFWKNQFFSSIKTWKLRSRLHESTIFANFHYCKNMTIFYIDFAEFASRLHEKHFFSARGSQNDEKWADPGLPGFSVGRPWPQPDPLDPPGAQNDAKNAAKIHNLYMKYMPIS